MTLLSRGLAAVFRAPPATNRKLRVQHDLRVPAPDGVGLLTDLYLTTATEPQPAVLIRTPYGRRGMFGAIARLIAERGYHVVCQSTRGTFGSGGEFDPGQEAEDGRATADWIIKQPWSNGEIGGYGASYLSYTQWALASTRPPQLKAMAILVYGAERRAANYPGGSFALDRALTWSYVIAKQLKRGPRGIERSLKPGLDHLPLAGADTAAIGYPVPFFRDWLEHESPGDPYWADTDFRPILPDLGIPVTMVGGWHDIYLPAMLADYQALSEAGQPVRLRVGAWRHGSLGVHAYGLRDALALFDQHLRGRPPRDLAPPPVQVDVTGDGWRELDRWPPPARTERWYLRPGGALSTAPPPVSEPDRYRYDPADPTPSVGGSALSANSGPKDNRVLEQRPDVLTYTSAPLVADLEVIGPVRASLYVTSSLEHTDFFARLCDVDPRGHSINITDGLLRLRPGAQAAGDRGQPIEIELWSTAHRFGRGHRVRLQVSSGAHPRYARNLGSGEPLATGTTMLTADQAVYHDPQRRSAVLLPVTTAHRQLG